MELTEEIFRLAVHVVKIEMIAAGRKRSLKQRLLDASPVVLKWKKPRWS